MKAQVATVTLTWNAEKDIEETMRCIHEQTLKPNVIIVVDNGSTDRTLEIIEKKFPSVKIIRMKRNMGICAGYNICFSKVPNNIKYVMVIDQDVFFEKNHFKKIIERFEQEDERTAVLMCDLREPLIKSFAIPEGYIKYFHGACFSYRNMYKKLMHFPEEFFGYNNEADLSVKLLDRNLRILFYPKCVMNHKKSLAKRTKFQTFYMTRNAMWFLWRNAPRKDAIIGTALEIIFDYSRASRSRTIPSYFMGLFSAVLGIPYCIRTRHPSNYVSYKDMQDIAYFKNIPIIRNLL
jgi:GT2 family glycosyltransferase